MGTLLAFFPIPGQSVVGALIAMWLRCNLPITIAFVWLTNPVTIPPVFFFTYKVGTWVLQEPERIEGFRLSWDWLVAQADATAIGRHVFA